MLTFYRPILKALNIAVSIRSALFIVLVEARLLNFTCPMLSLLKVSFGSLVLLLLYWGRSIVCC